MKILIPLVTVAVLALIANFGVGQMGLTSLFGVWIPYVAFATFVLGFSYKIYYWARTPVPFRIPTTCGQQKGLDWIPNNKLEAPHSTLSVIARMALEVLFFRSLFRNTKATLVKEDKSPRLVYESDKLLWLAGLIFHWSFLVVFLRHYRFFLQPVPGFVKAIEAADGFVQLTLPAFYLTDALFVVGVTVLFLRRVFDKKVKHISLPADYFPLFLILGIALTGMQMRYGIKVDVTMVKNHMQGLMSFNPSAQEIGSLFYVHLFLVSVLAMYFPFSKLMHMGGVFMSPTRNMANTSREKRHINPWNPEVGLRTYESYENDFRDKMKSAGLPVEKD